MTEVDVKLGRQIRRLREQLGMSQEELAKKLGYKSKSSINKVETGSQGLTQSKIMRFAEALQTTPGEPWDIDRSKITLQELFNLWREKKAPKKGRSSQQAMASAFKHCARLHTTPYCQIKAYDMQDTGMQHVPHECRHTFRSRLDSAGANRVCIDRLMGHKSGNTGERVYTYKILEELRANIELITN